MAHDVRRALALLLPVLITACASGPEVPSPRPLVIHSGARITVEPERMAEIDAWVESAVETIQEDPTFLIVSVREDDVGYPWESVTIAADTATVNYEGNAPDIRIPYEIYGFLHLMADDDRLEEWLPEAADATGYELERAILDRVADTWLYGRAVWDLAPYRLLDELIYARDAGFLDAYLLTLRADEFPRAREAWLEENPGRVGQYEAWFEETWGREPPTAGEASSGGG